LRRADCAAGTVCGLTVLDYNMICGEHGVCTADADCAAGRVCVDLWGDGVRTCEPEGASCGPGTCPPGQICASPIEGGPPRCLGG
jgi:Cys-rich repeat protein